MLNMGTIYLYLTFKMFPDRFVIFYEGLALSGLLHEFLYVSDII